MVPPLPPVRTQDGRRKCWLSLAVSLPGRAILSNAEEDYDWR